MEKAPNLRKPDSCCNCKHNKKVYPSVDCDIYPVKTDSYSFEIVCNDYSKEGFLLSAVKQQEQPKPEPLQQIFLDRDVPNLVHFSNGSPSLQGGEGSQKQIFHCDVLTEILGQVK